MRGFLVVVSVAGLAMGLVAASSAGHMPGEPVVVWAPAASKPTPTPAPTPAPRAVAKPVRSAVIRPHVRIGGVRVGWLDAGSATSTIERAFARPFAVVVDDRWVRVDPTRFATPYAPTAVAKALRAAPGTSVDLVVSVHGAPIRAYVAKLARRFDRPGVPARLMLRAGRPFVSADHPGRRLDRSAVVAGIAHALAANQRKPLYFKTKSVVTGPTRSQLRPVILINRSLNRLTFYTQGEARQFAVATGQSVYPTPAGRFQIVVKWTNPWWYPPNSSWAKGLSPVPPGPGNPLGTRWMGLSAPGVGIHGTNNPSSIGYSVSHGCIRMQVPDAEWLFDHVGIGTTVFIV